MGRARRIQGDFYVVPDIRSDEPVVVRLVKQDAVGWASVAAIDLKIGCLAVKAPISIVVFGEPEEMQ